MVKHDFLKPYFPHLSEEQWLAIEKLYPIYHELNEKINLISRKDFDNFYVHHVLHSLALTKFCDFPSGAEVIDIGTGGGFPGIPLAIFYPNVQFTLVDSIAKKIRAVDEVIDILNLQNAKALNIRTEQIHKKFDIATARAVAPMTDLWKWMIGKWKNRALFYLLKGGDLSAEMNELLQIFPKAQFKQNLIFEAFPEPFFETKKVIQIK
jgi:16S rRNA (guanine527-N7)-methyltransferase